ncbi:hypothetical protein CAPTEDRAFT_212786 [Capitella teleta]|uniref:Uncharacterized protein n=1 Tax=Capitella teleta TaxID=283909 RepID=R7TGG5_CAPTE|nr:hypothetical protein CAPTEDRAFT_212786 [Capitella teleta]|eukprot:ELT90661.1 hypothetical protein CAPTEDRAFT_212786 [Capitella teleta]
MARVSPTHEKPEMSENKPGPAKPKKVQITEPEQQQVTRPSGPRRKYSQYAHNWFKGGKDAGPKAASLAFFGFLGICMISLGIGLTYYATDTDLSDFYLIGIGAILMGCLFIGIGVFMICRESYKKKKRRREIEDIMNKNNSSRAVDSYQLPPDTHEKAADPVDLYGSVSVSKVTQPTRKVSMPMDNATSSEPETEQGQHRSLGVTMPREVGESLEGLNNPCYHVPLPNTPSDITISTVPMQRSISVEGPHGDPDVVNPAASEMLSSDL